MRTAIQPALEKIQTALFHPIGTYRRHKNINETESNITHLTRFIPKRVTDHMISGHPSTCGLKVIYDLKPAECPGEKERDGHHCHPKVQDSWINLDQPV